MQSGLNDFEGYGTYDSDLLKPENSHKVNPPVKAFEFVGSLPAKSPCPTQNCTWAFYPGTHTMYSSTNFLLAGFVLLAHAPEGKNTWEKFDMIEMLGLDKADYPNLHFANTGPACDNGLTMPGLSMAFGKAESYTQDQSIMGWCCGHGLSSPRDVARFYFDLLGPVPKIVSEESRQIMQNFTLIDQGWATNGLIYGGGIMVEWFENIKSAPHLGYNSSFIGHGGMTYGFQSNQGFNKALNASVSIGSNQDFDSSYPIDALCHITQIISKYKNVEQNFTCAKLEQSNFGCTALLGKDPVCFKQIQPVAP
jgi:CubicO group peptidase (beta-lactamase class C family)